MTPPIHQEISNLLYLQNMAQIWVYTSLPDDKSIILELTNQSTFPNIKDHSSQQVLLLYFGKILEKMLLSYCQY